MKANSEFLFMAIKHLERKNSGLEQKYKVKNAEIIYLSLFYPHFKKSNLKASAVRL